MRRDTSYAPKIVPRWSLPAMTSARRTPGSGSRTTCCSEVSHLPAIPVTSSFPARTRPSISGLAPMVPTSTGSLCAGTRSTETAGATLVTRSMSVRRSPTTRTTPGKSLPLTTSGAATPRATNGKEPGRGEVTT